MKTTLFVVYVSALFVFGCRDNAEISADGQVSKSENFVPMNVALEVALMQAPTGAGKTGIFTSGQKKIASNRIYSEQGGAATAYIINYEGGGFAIIASDNRSFPILAYSESGRIPDDLTKCPPGMLEWLSKQDRFIKDLRASDQKQTPATQKFWNDVKLADSFMDGPKVARTNSDCSYEGQATDEYSTKELTTIRWGQHAPYNNDMAYAGCAQTTNGKYPAGCVAVACAIVMQFHKKAGAGYDWAGMQANPNHPDVARLIRTLGNTANLLNSYDCGGTWAVPWLRLIPTFENFGYPSPSKSSVNFYTIRDNIILNRPVIMNGKDVLGGDSHCWVVDGYKTWDHFICHWDIIDGEYQKIYQSSTGHLKMSWGWAGGEANGWYGFQQYFVPNHGDYSDDNKIFYNIRPN